jgi:hypothetical protein
LRGAARRGPRRAADGGRPCCAPGWWRGRGAPPGHTPAQGRPLRVLAGDAESLRRAIAAAEQDRIPTVEAGSPAPAPRGVAPLLRSTSRGADLGGMSTQLRQAQGSEGPSACILSRPAWAGPALGGLSGHEDCAGAGPPLSTASRKERDAMSPIALEQAGHSPTASEAGTRLGAQNTSSHTSVLWRLLLSRTLSTVPTEALL